MKHIPFSGTSIKQVERVATENYK